jgi:hypothetical protein
MVMVMLIVQVVMDTDLKIAQNVMEVVKLKELMVRKLNARSVMVADL